MDGQVADELFVKADKAMYRSKRRNKGTGPRSTVVQPKVASVD
jgi:GGDEF domain-containing protein